MQYSIFMSHQYTCPNQTPHWHEPSIEEQQKKLQQIANSSAFEKLKGHVMKSMTDIAIKPLKSLPTEEELIKGHHCIFCTVTKEKLPKRSPGRCCRKSAKGKSPVEGLTKEQQKELEARLLADVDYMAMYQALRNYKRYTRLPPIPDPLHLRRPGREEVKMMVDSQRLTSLFERSFLHRRRNPFRSPPRGHSPRPAERVGGRDLRKCEPPAHYAHMQETPVTISLNKLASSALAPIEV